MNIILRIILSTFAVLITSYLLPGVKIDSVYTAIFVAVLLGFLNNILRPILVYVTIPATVFTLGLFLFVINAAMVMLCSKLINGFVVEGFWSAVFFSIILSFISSLLNLSPKNRNNSNQ